LAGSDNDSYFDALSIRLVEANCPTLSATDIAFENEIKVFPNPAMDKLFYRSAAAFNHLVITDALGREIYNTNFVSKQNHVDISNLSQGMYVITFIGNNRKQSFKFIKME